MAISSVIRYVLGDRREQGDTVSILLRAKLDNGLSHLRVAALNDFGGP
jgi:hypothetical protein